MVGGVAGAVAGVATARTTTKAEQEHIARKIRNEIGKKKEMTAKERAKWEKIRNNPESTPEQVKEAVEKLGYREEDLKEDES
jgi:gas vesicle protein